MRTTRSLRAGGFAGALSVAMLTGSSSAEAAATADGPAPLPLGLADARLTFGELATATAVAPAWAAGRRASLELRPQRVGAPWRVIGSRFIRSPGRYRVRGRPDESGSLRLRISASSGERDTFSRPRRLRVSPRLEVAQRRLQISAGRRVAVSGRVAPNRAGLAVALQVVQSGRWATLDTDRTGTRGRYELVDRRQATMSARARIKVSGRPAGLAPASRGLGRIEVYRRAYASWYGPGLYGNRLGCGGRLGTASLGVAHKTLPCGTLVTLRRSGRTIRVPVIDRGPYVSGREYDLTAATARRLGFRGHGPILVTR